MYCAGRDEHERADDLSAEQPAEVTAQREATRVLHPGRSSSARRRRRTSCAAHGVDTVQDDHFAQLKQARRPTWCRLRLAEHGHERRLAHARRHVADHNGIRMYVASNALRAVSLCDF